MIPISDSMPEFSTNAEILESVDPIQIVKIQVAPDDQRATLKSAVLTTMQMFSCLV